MSTYDFAINGGHVVDGTGIPRRRLNVAVAEGRIAELSTDTLRGRHEIDATGQVVAPGFIDLHTHADYTLQQHPDAVTQLHQGVTTLVTGNCGHSPFPVTDVELARSASDFDDSALSWTWRDAAGFAEAIGETRPAVNVGLQIGHNAVRLAVLGQQDRPPDEDELAQMCRFVETAAEQGVVGFSTGLIYAPGVFAGPDEVRALVRTAASRGLLYSTHMRNESARMLDGVREAIEAAESGGARLELSHLKAMGPANHGSVIEALALLDAARERRVDVTADVYPYTASSTSLLSRLPAWAIDGGKDALLARLADPATRGAIAAGLAERFGRDVDPDGVVLADVPPGRYHDRIGFSITDIGRADGVEPAEAALRVIEHHQASVMIVNHAMSEADVATVLAHPQVSVASDGWTLSTEPAGRPHPRSFGTFARVLGRYVRERNTLALEEAVRKMTSLPATRIHADQRGVLRTGNAADICVFDPDTVVDNATFQQPWQLASGCTNVLVNGVAAVRDGELTGQRSGRLLAPVS